MKKKLLILLQALFVFTGLAQAQTVVTIPSTPPATTVRSRYPLSGQSDYERAAILLKASEVGPTIGTITKVGFWLDTVGAAPATVPVKLYLKNVPDTSITASTWATLTTGLTPSFDDSITATAFLTAGAPNWYNIVLTTPFQRSSNSSLLILVETNVGPTGTNDPAIGGIGKRFLASNAGNGKFRGYNANNAPPTNTGTASPNRTHVRLEITPLSGTDLGLSSLTSPVMPLAAGATVPVTFTFDNNGTTAVTTASFSYQVNNNAVVTETWNGNLAANAQGNYSFTAQITVPSSGSNTIKVWTSSANGAPDLIRSNDTLSYTFCPAVSGTLTVGSGGTYPTLKSAIDVLNCGGISGPVSVQINPGTYTESVSLGAVIGMSATNTITFSSSNNTASAVILKPDTTVSWVTLDFNGAKYVTVKNLSFMRDFLPVPAGGGGGGTASILLRARNGADSLVVKNCVFKGDSAGVTTTSNQGISVVLSGGAEIKNNVFSYLATAVNATGTAAPAPLSANNTISNNEFANVVTSITVTNQDNLVINGNQINGVAGTGTTTYPITINKMSNSVVKNNRIVGALSLGGISITDPDSGNVANRVFNNAVYGTFRSTTPRVINVAGTYAMGGGGGPGGGTHNPYDHIEIYNNTGRVSSSVASTTANSWGLVHITGGTLAAPAWWGIAIKNNIMSCTGTIGAAARALFLNNDSIRGVTTSNNNVWYIQGIDTLFQVANTAGGGGGGGATTRMPYTAANWSATFNQDLNSKFQDPLFAGTSLNPRNVQVDNIGTPISYISTDITGANRSATTPDAGAYEFNASGPAISFLEDLNDTCVNVARTVHATVSGTAALSSVTLYYNLNGSASGPFSSAVMTGSNGNYTGTIPAGSPGVAVYYGIVAIDINNLTDTSARYSYVNAYLNANAGADKNISAGQSTQVGNVGGGKSGLLIGEILYARNGAGAQTTWPAYLTGVGNTVDMIEISNLDQAPINLAGKKFGLMDTLGAVLDYPLPAVSLASRSSMLLLGGTGTDDPANNVYYLGNANANFITANSLRGFYLQDTLGTPRVLDAVAMGATYFWPASAPVTAADFSGRLTGLFGTAGVRRVGMDTDSSSNWRVDNAQNPSSIGTTNAGLIGTYWTNTAGAAAGYGTQITVAPLVTTSYVYYVNDGVCTSTDTAVVNVSGTVTVDIAATRISSPGASVTVNTPTAVTMWVKNNSAVPVSGFNVGYRATIAGFLNGSGNQTVGAAVNPGDSVQVTFNTNWTPNTIGTYSLKAFVNISGDANAANDTVVNSVVVAAQASTDLAVLSISSPAAGSQISGTTAISALVKNNGTTVINTVPLAWNVNNGAPIQQSFTRTLNPGDTATLSFTQNWTPAVGGSYLVKVFVNGLSGDNNVSNDTASVNVSSTVAVKNVNGTVQRVYPNPASQTLFIETTYEGTPLRAQMIDLSGRVVLDRNVQNLGERFSLSVDGLPAGLYELRLSGAEFFQSVKVLIQR